MKKKYLISGGIILTFILLVTGLVFYYQERDHQNKQQELKILLNQTIEKGKQKDQQEEKLNECLARAYSAHQERWNNSCKRLGREVSCGLPEGQAKWYDTQHIEAANICIKIYK